MGLFYWVINYNRLTVVHYAQSLCKNEFRSFCPILKLAPPSCSDLMFESHFFFALIVVVRLGTVDSSLAAVSWNVCSDSELDIYTNVL